MDLRDELGPAIRDAVAGVLEDPQSREVARRLGADMAAQPHLDTIPAIIAEVADA